MTAKFVNPEHDTLEIDAIHALCQKTIMRSLVIEQIAHHICTAVIPDENPPATAPILFGTDDAQPLGAPDNMFATAIGPVFRFLSIFNQDKARIHYAGNMMIGPARFLEAIAEYSPSKFKHMARHFYHLKYNAQLRDHIAASTVLYFLFNHKALTRTGEWVSSNLGKSEVGTVIIDTGRIRDEIYDSFWEYADMAVTARTQGFHLCIALLAEMVEDPPCGQLDHRNWITDIDTSQADKINLFLKPTATAPMVMM